MTRILAAFLAVIVSVLAAAAQSSTGGDQQFHLIAANSNNSTLIAAGEHTVHGVQVSTIANAPGYLKLYDKVTAPTCGTDTPKKVIAIPAAATAANGMANNVVISLGTQFQQGLGICVVTGIADSDNTSVAATSFNINIDWK
jgi:hypothetical protein